MPVFSDSPVAGSVVGLDLGGVPEAWCPLEVDLFGPAEEDWRLEFPCHGDLRGGTDCDFCFIVGRSFLHQLHVAWEPILLLTSHHAEHALH